jgi:hypothetical protein
MDSEEEEQHQNLEGASDEDDFDIDDDEEEEEGAEEGLEEAMESAPAEPSQGKSPQKSVGRQSDNTGSGEKDGVPEEEKKVENEHYDLAVDVNDSEEVESDDDAGEQPGVGA